MIPFRTRRTEALLRGALLAVAALLLTSSGAPAAVTTTPAATTVSVATAVTVTYRLTGIQLLAGGAYTGTLTSPSADISYCDSSDPVAGPVTVRVVNGSGTFTETVNIPQAALNAARSPACGPVLFLGRSFNAPGVLGDGGQMTINLGSSAAFGPLAVQRLELTFENRRGEITVKRNRRGLKAFAEMKYAGSGLLTGYWEVDGRRISDVMRNLSFGTSATLETPDTPDLPTFETGTHVVRFVPTNPPPGFPLPVALYYVTPGEENVRQVTIPVVEQTTGAGSPGGTKHVFRWDAPKGIGLFYLEFTEEPGGKPVFSAFTKEGSYALPRVAESRFVPGQRYYWRVKGFDPSDSQVGESAPTPFIF